MSFCSVHGLFQRYIPGHHLHYVHYLRLGVFTPVGTDGRPPAHMGWREGGREGDIPRLLGALFLLCSSGPAFASSTSICSLQRERERERERVCVCVCVGGPVLIRYCYEFFVEFALRTTVKVTGKYLPN